MVGWIRISFCTLLVLGTTLPLLADSGIDGATPPLNNPTADPIRLRAEGEAAEKKGQWEKALECYLRAYISGRPTAELRERIRFCLRHSTQTRRHRDPAFQQFILSLPVADALNLYAETIQKLSTLYADRDRSAPARLFALGLDELDRALNDAAFRDRHLDNANPTKIQKFQRSIREDWKHRLPAVPQETRLAVREVVAEAQRQLGVQTPAAIVFEFLCGACTGLDEHTVFVTPSGAHAELASPILEFAAYGILIRFSENHLIVDELVPGSWAALHSGLRKGDRITRVNSRELGPANPNSLTKALQFVGMAGHELELAPSMAGTQAPLLRLPVPVPTVYGVEILNTRDGIAYLRIAAFRETTPRELEDTIFALKERGVRSLIIDLRGNSGGLFTAGVQVAQRFLPSGIVVTTQGQSPEFSGRVFSSDAGMNAFDLPVVLLIDTRTMSAAEAVAAAWKDHNRAILVGMPTFGKGVIQSPVRLSAADTAENPTRSGVLILTVASMFAPRGTAINGIGVTPHILETDPTRQLEIAVTKAIELVTGGR